MPSFTRADVQFLHTCCQLYTKDGLRRPKEFPRVSPGMQNNLMRSALRKLSSAFSTEELTQAEAIVLCMAVTDVVQHYEVECDLSALEKMYDQLAARAATPD